MNASGQKYLFWEGDAHLPPHTLSEVFCGPLWLERNLSSTWGLGKAQAWTCGGDEGSRLRTPSAPWDRDKSLKLELSQVRHLKDWVDWIRPSVTSDTGIPARFTKSLCNRAHGQQLGIIYTSVALKVYAVGFLV